MEKSKVLGSRFQLNPTKEIFQFSRGKMIYLIIDGAGIIGYLSGRKLSRLPYLTAYIQICNPSGFNLNVKY